MKLDRRGMGVGAVLIVALGTLGAGCGSSDDDGGGSSDTVSVDEEAADVTWNLNAAQYRGQLEKRIAFDCPADGEPGQEVWGTGTYTDDSSVCKAAVHAGLITYEDGGRVVIEIAEGQDEYKGSEANGVITLDYGSWGGSFTFPEAD